MTTRVGKSGRVVEVTLYCGGTPDEYKQYSLTASIMLIPLKEAGQETITRYPKTGGALYRNWISTPTVVEPLTRLARRNNPLLGQLELTYVQPRRTIVMGFRPFEIADRESRVSRAITDEVELSILRMVQKGFPDVQHIEEFGTGPARKKELARRGIPYRPGETVYDFEPAVQLLAQKVARKRIVAREKKYVHRAAKWALSTRLSLAVRKGWRAFRIGIRKGARR